MIHLYFKRLALLCCILSIAFIAQAQAPSGYYAAAKGKKGAALKTALFGIVADHTERSYKQLWEDFKLTDMRKDGTIWDMYSNATSYEPGGTAQGANYKAEGDSYNREHSFPKSWFNEGTPMYTDLFHLYPTDGYVNGRRSNYPFGETKGETYQSAGGFSKLGSSTLSGYSGTVFEPADEYKGDFARTYFYMATAYEDQIASWSSPMLAGNKYPAYATWAIDMLLRWAKEDPVSEKEIARNNAVYKIQKNRNPYIDYPGLEQYVWGSTTSTAFDPNSYTNPNDIPTPSQVGVPTFTPASGVVDKGTKVTITTATQGAKIVYKVNGGEALTQAAPVEIVINEPTSITAYTSLGDEVSESVTATYSIKGESPVGSNVYQLLTRNDQLKAGAQVLIVCQDKGTAMAEQGSDIRNYAWVEIDADASITTEVNVTEKPYAFLVGGQSGAWSLYDQSANVYLALTSAKNKLYTSDTASDDTALWTINIASDGTATITNNAYTDRSLQYNANAPRFACYTSQQQAVSLFALLTSEGIAQITPDKAGRVSVFSLNGYLVRTASTATEALCNLPAGIYIVGGQKVLVK